jgi:hypothetical protein
MPIEIPNSFAAAATVVPAPAPPFTTALVSSQGVQSYERLAAGVYEFVLTVPLAFKECVPSATLPANVNLVPGAQVTSPGRVRVTIVDPATGDFVDPPAFSLTVFAFTVSEGVSPELAMTIRWGDPQVDANRNWTSVAYGADVFVKAGWQTTDTHGRIAWSDDGGKTWNEVAIPGITDTSRQLYGAYWAPTNAKFYVVEYANPAGGKVLSSPDGKVWTVNTGVIQQPTNIVEAGNGSGDLVCFGFDAGDGKIIQRSVDGGVNWVDVPAPVGVTFAYACASSPTAIVAASGGAFGIRSTDNGQTFSAIPSPPAAGAYVSDGGLVYDDATGLFVGSGGTDDNASAAWISDDDGLTWSGPYPQSDNYLYSLVNVPGTPTLYVSLLGDFNGSDLFTVLESSGGREWVGSTPPIGDKWSALAYAPPLRTLVGVSAPQSGLTPGKTVVGLVG